MAGMTLEQAQSLLDAARSALQTALAKPEEYTVGDRSFKRTNIATLTQAVAEAEARVVRLQRGGIRQRRGVAL